MESISSAEKESLWRVSVAEVVVEAEVAGVAEVVDAAEEVEVVAAAAEAPISTRSSPLTFTPVRKQASVILGRTTSAVEQSSLR